MAESCRPCRARVASAGGAIEFVVADSAGVPAEDPDSEAAAQ